MGVNPYVNHLYNDLADGLILFQVPFFHFVNLQKFPFQEFCELTYVFFQAIFCFLSNYVLDLCTENHFSSRFQAF